MVLDDSFQHLLVTGMVPDAIRPDDGDRPRFADSQAIGLAPGNTTVIGEPELAQSLLEIFPSLAAIFARTAFPLARFGAKEDVPYDPIASQGLERLPGLLHPILGHG